jgi:hypothetical protein
MRPNSDLGLECPTTSELIEAWNHRGPLNEHPTIQRLLAICEAENNAARPRLTLIRGGRDA